MTSAYQVILMEEEPRVLSLATIIDNTGLDTLWPLMRFGNLSPKSRYIYLHKIGHNCVL